MTSRSYLSIGDVLSLLREEFPDVTISKIRFLESQGLVNPERSPSGYRKFYDHDVERLRWVLRQQREHFLPLKVIRDRLAQDTVGPAAEGARDADPSGEGTVRTPVRSNGSPTTVARATEPSCPEPTPVLEAANRRDQTRVHEPVGADLATMALAPALGAPARQAVAPEAVRESSGPVADGAPRPPQADHSRMSDMTAQTANGPLSGVARATPGTRTPDPPVSQLHSAVTPAGPPTAPPASPGSGRTMASSVPPGATPTPRRTTPGTPTQPGASTPSVPRDAAPTTGAASTGNPPPSRSGSGPGVPRTDSAPAFDPATGVSGVSLTAEELSGVSGLSATEVAALEGFGLVEPMVVAGVLYYDEEALTVAKLVAEFGRYGIEPRHLRLYRNAIEREVGLIEQIVTPLLRQRNPESRQRAAESTADLARLGQSLRASLLRKELRRQFGS